MKKDDYDQLENFLKIFTHLPSPHDMAREIETAYVRQLKTCTKPSHTQAAAAIGINPSLFTYLLTNPHRAIKFTTYQKVVKAYLKVIIKFWKEHD